MLVNISFNYFVNEVLVTGKFYFEINLLRLILMKDINSILTPREMGQRDMSSILAPQGIGTERYEQYPHPSRDWDREIWAVSSPLKGLEQRNSDTLQNLVNKYPNMHCIIYSIKINLLRGYGIQSWGVLTPQGIVG